MLTSIIGLQLQTPMYESYVKMLISGEKQVVSPYYRDLTGSSRSLIARTQSEIVKSRPVLERAVRALKLHERPVDYEKRFCSDLKKYLIDYRLKKLNEKLVELNPVERREVAFRRAEQYLKRNIEVESIRDTNLFIIKVKDFSAQRAAEIANVVSRSYCIFDLEQQLAELRIKFGKRHPKVIRLQNNIYHMNETLSGARIDTLSAIGKASVKTVEQANIPFSPTGQSKRIIITLALIMSIFIGIMLAFVFDYINHTFKSPQDIESFLNLPYFGSILNKRLNEEVIIKDAKKESAYTQSYRILSDKLYSTMKQDKLKTILIISAQAHEGTTSIVVNLGFCLSQKLGQKVLIVDANFRYPSIHDFFGFNNESGFVNIFDEEKNDMIHNADPNLSVLSAGKTTNDPVAALGGGGLKKSIRSLKEKYGVVIFDCINLNNSIDAILLSTHVDGVILVVHEGKTRRQVVKNAIEPLVQNKANIIGVILNRRKHVIPKFIYNRL